MINPSAVKVSIKRSINLRSGSFLVTVRTVFHRPEDCSTLSLEDANENSSFQHLDLITISQNWIKISQRLE